MFDQLLIFVNLYQHAKSQLIPFLNSSDTVNFTVQRQDWSNLFLTKPNQKIFNQLLIFVNVHLHAENEAASSIFCGELLDLRILQSDWLRAL